MNILLIDDDESMRNCIRYFLERAGHTVYEYNRAEGAEDYTLEMRPDLALIDHNLGPKGTTTGLEIAGPLQREGLRVVLMSGDSTVRGYANLAGVQFVEKCDIRHLLDKVEGTSHG
jgi:DNA-binding response OmpR family regulator